LAFITDKHELKSGLIIFRRADVKHQNWYCRIKIPHENRYKTLSLETQDIHAAKDKAFDADADIRFRLKHEVPIFEKSFADVAKEYSEHHKQLKASGQITPQRWSTVDTYIRLHLIPYAGHTQIALMNEEKWRSYFPWRKENGKGRDGGKPKDSSIRHEMKAFLAILNYAADKGYIRDRQVPRGKALPGHEGRREEFTPKEYRHLHTFARGWIKDAPHERSKWHRTTVYNFMLIMTNTGMRTMEARNLRWRDYDLRTDRHGRQFVCLNVRGKDKYRELVAPHSVADYFERIRAISKAVGPDDFIFTSYDGKSSSTLYQDPIGELFKKSGLLMSSSGSRRSAYCFRHTYATFRLMEGVDSIFLAKQMGTSVKMIEDHYGHITPAKNAERILQGIPGWEPIENSSGGNSRSVHASGAGTKTTAKPEGEV